jgi:hypothetical protein
MTTERGIRQYIEIGYIYIPPLTAPQKYSASQLSKKLPG